MLQFEVITLLEGGKQLIVDLPQSIQSWLSVKEGDKIGLDQLLDIERAQTKTNYHPSDALMLIEAMHPHADICSLLSIPQQFHAGVRASRRRDGVRTLSVLRLYYWLHQLPNNELQKLVMRCQLLNLIFNQELAVDPKQN